MGEVIELEDKAFDLTFDMIPITQITPEMFGIRFHSKRAKDLWKKFKDENNIYLSDYDNRLTCVDVLIPTVHVKSREPELSGTEARYNPVLEFVMLARKKGLHTNEYE